MTPLGNWDNCYLLGQINDRVFSVPDYLNDLNAMHEAEKLLDDQIYSYTMWIIKILKWIARREPTFALIHATAPQRAEGLLRTIGKWEE